MQELGPRRRTVQTHLTGTYCKLDIKRGDGLAVALMQGSYRLSKRPWC